MDTSGREHEADARADLERAVELGRQIAGWTATAQGQAAAAAAGQQAQAPRPAGAPQVWAEGGQVQWCGVELGNGVSLPMDGTLMAQWMEAVTAMRAALGQRLRHLEQENARLRQALGGSGAGDWQP